MTGETLPPGSMIGVVGGGQLGRMLAISAAQLGYRCHIFAPNEFCCAAEVSAQHTQADYDDEAALADFAETVDVITYEFENVPAAPLRTVAEATPVYPPIDALELSQDRLAEKDFIREHGGRPAPYRAVDSIGDIAHAVEDIGTPGIVKTRRFGYDGKGQSRIFAADGAEPAWRNLGGQPSVYEAFIDFENEFSIILARGIDGEIRLYDPPRNRHADGILSTSTVPGEGIIPDQRAAASTLARSVAESLEYVGVLTMEFFTALDGPIFNEMAPRVHNSGHWTIEGAATSQFENHIRAICGLPLGETGLTADRIEMTNLIGSEVERWGDWLKKDQAHLHLYNKGEARPGRKMGHVTQLF
ncbi:MAG: 5-(carboxyamino)imidazole ribonucleotide synthase [Sphingomonadaceae bacterium]|nr:5-(carboxyamino)imidazole ribonucleotide synthase [Sphingomonadaceae bacterium]